MTGRRFIVSCLHCKRIIVIAGRIADPELDQLHTHLRACYPHGVDGFAPAIEATLRHYRVMPTDSE